MQTRLLARNGRTEQKLDDTIGVGVGASLEQHCVDNALKMAVLTPMPSPKAATAATVKPGFFEKI
jgi:hypothetical protein